MYEILVKAHSGVAYLVLLLLLVASVNAIAGLVSKRNFSATDRKIGLFTLIFSHTQLLIGIVIVGFLFFDSEVYLHMGEIMKSKPSREMFVEHPVINIIAIALITIGWSKHKRMAEGNVKFKPFAIFYTLGLLLILTRVPWDKLF